MVVIKSIEGDPAFSAVALFALAPRALKLALVFQSGFACKILFGELLGLGNHVPRWPSTCSLGQLTGVGLGTPEVRVCFYGPSC